MTDGGPNLGSPNGARFWVHKGEELNEGLRRECHAAGVLAVGRVERSEVALVKEAEAVLENLGAPFQSGLVTNCRLSNFLLSSSASS